jgi:C_GCAxxG_C_C family probable redox protein
VESEQRLAAVRAIAHDNGFRYEAEYRGCAQCTVAAIQDALGLCNDTVFRAATCLGGGIGKIGDSACGAYSGAAIMIGFIWGRDRQRFDGDRENLDLSYDLTKRYHAWFLAEFGGCRCREVQEAVFGRSFDLWDPEDKRLFEEAGAHRDKCTVVVGRAAAQVTAMILEQMERLGVSRRDFENLVNTAGVSALRGGGNRTRRERTKP